MDTPEDTAKCRLCGTDLDGKEYLKVFEEPDLLEKIQKVLPVTIEAEDDFSKCICCMCYGKVALYYQFTEDCLNFEKELGVESSPGSVRLKKLDTLADKLDGTIAKETADGGTTTIHQCPKCNANLFLSLTREIEDGEETLKIKLTLANEREYLVLEDGNIGILEFVDSSPKNDFQDEPLEILEENVHNEVTVETEEITEQPVEVIEVKEEQPKEKKPIKSKSRKRTRSRNSSSNARSSSGKIIKVESVSETLYSQLSSEILLGNEESDDEDTTKGTTSFNCSQCGITNFSKQIHEFHMLRHTFGEMVDFTCPICNEKSANEDQLWVHYFYVHKDSQQYLCLTCGKLFLKPTRLKDHQEKYRHSGMKKITISMKNDPEEKSEPVEKPHEETVTPILTGNCTSCGQLVSDLDPTAINDVITCAECECTLSLMVDPARMRLITKRQYRCTLCSKPFSTKQRCEFHEMRHGENMKDFTCSTCKQEFRTENSLYEHYLFVHKGLRPHICELCGKTFQLKMRLKEHLRTHTGERPFQCDICGVRCMTNNGLKLHKKSHSQDNRYSCEVCNKSFRKKQNIDEHIEKHWIKNKDVALSKTFLCPKCLEVLPTFRMLKHHLIDTHEVNEKDPILNEQKPWHECNFCHEKFKHQMTLKAHKERMHEGRADTFQCDVCNVSFKVKQRLANHIRLKHNGEKRYKCVQCGKGFNNTKSMYSHILLHTGQKPYSCDHCGITFRRKDSCTRHQKQHYKVLPHACQFCEEKFSSKKALSNHQKKEHLAEIQSPCPDCQELCTPEQLKIHLNMHLGEKLQEIEGTQVGEDVEEEIGAKAGGEEELEEEIEEKEEDEIDGRLEEEHIVRKLQEDVIGGRLEEEEEIVRKLEQEVIDGKLEEDEIDEKLQDEEIEEIQEEVEEKQEVDEIEAKLQLLEEVEEKPETNFQGKEEVMIEEKQMEIVQVQEIHEEIFISSELNG